MAKDDACVVVRVKGIPVAMRGRKPLTPKRTEYGKQIRKAYESHEIAEQRKNIQQLEPRCDGIANCITTVQKDSMYIGKVERMEASKKGMFEDKGGTTVYDYLYEAKDGDLYGVFKLSPRECGRLMGVSDKDIDKMLSVNSNSQCYKQFGNSIVTSVLMAIFSQLNIKGVKPWNDMTQDEKEELIRKDQEFIKKGDNTHELDFGNRTSA